MNSRIGLTWPNALPVAVYAQILLSVDPEGECRVPVATMSEDSGIQSRLRLGPSRTLRTDAAPARAGRIFANIRPRPGSIFLLRRTWWAGRESRKEQVRGRLEDGVYGGWNMSSSTHPAVRPIVGDQQQRKLVVDYLSRRKCDPAGDLEAEEPVPGGLKRHEIFLVDSAYDSALPPSQRSPLPNLCVIHYVQDDAQPNPRVMLPNPPVLLLDEVAARTLCSSPTPASAHSSPITARHSPFPPRPPIIRTASPLKYVGSPSPVASPSLLASPSLGPQVTNVAAPQRMFGKPISGSYPVAMVLPTKPMRRPPSHFRPACAVHSIPIAYSTTTPCATPYKTAGSPTADGALTPMISAPPFLEQLRQQAQVRTPLPRPTMSLIHRRFIYNEHTSRHAQGADPRVWALDMHTCEYMYLRLVILAYTWIVTRPSLNP